MKIATSRRIRGGLGAALLLAFGAFPALGQGFSAPPPAGAGRSQACLRLEGQLSAIDRGVGDPARADQIRRYEEAANKQQVELDRVLGQSRRIGCQGSGFFALFSGQPAQCGEINTQVQQMRANLDRILMDLERLQGGTADRESQRRSVLAALSQNDCGPQYRVAATTQPRGFFDALFGPGSVLSPAEPYQSSTFRTVCVRTCDGFYFPVSYSTTPSRFAEDERACQRMCPSAEVKLYSYRNPGEEITQAVSIDGQAYTELPAAFRYRQQVDRACSCKRSGQSWADALKTLEDDTIEQGDIVVTEERAKQLSQPKVDAQGRPQKPAPRTATPAPAVPTTAETAAAPTTAAPGEKRKVRTVGPTFYPVR